MQPGFLNILQEIILISCPYNAPKKPGKVCRRINVPFNSAQFRKFCTDNDIEQSFSSSTHTQSNGMAESAVKINKNIWLKSSRTTGGFLPFLSFEVV